MLKVKKEKFLIALTHSKLTSTQLAEKAGVSRVVISKIINGRQSSIRPQTLGKIVDALNIQPEDLL